MIKTFEAQAVKYFCFSGLKLIILNIKAKVNTKEGSGLSEQY